MGHLRSHLRRLEYRVSACLLPNPFTGASDLFFGPSPTSHADQPLSSWINHIGESLSFPQPLSGPPPAGATQVAISLPPCATGSPENGQRCRPTPCGRTPLHRLMGQKTKWAVKPLLGWPESHNELSKMEQC
jgi:hypothetical protein